MVKLNKVNEDMRINYFFINLHNKCNSKEIINPNDHFFQKLWRFPGDLNLVPVPQEKIPKFIKANDIVLSAALYQSFSSGDCQGLISFHFPAAFNIYLGGRTAIFRNAMSKFFHDLSMQALSISNNALLIKFETITELIKDINSLLKKVFDFKKQKEVIENKVFI